MSKSFVVAIFTEGEFAGIHVHGDAHHTEECADSYADGVRRGSNLYGAGSCDAYVLPRDTADMRADQPGAEFECAMEAYAEDEGCKA